MRLPPDVVAKVDELAIPARPRAEVAPGRWVLTILDWHPVLLNKLLKSHRMKAARHKEHDFAVVLAESLIQEVPKATRKRRVGIRISGKRLGDPDGYLKSLLDALVRAGLLVDDRAKWCVCDMPILEAGKKFTEITLEDM